jgi:hypothetical protein
VFELSSDSLSPQFNTFSVNKLRWNPKGDRLLLLDKGNAMLAFPGYDFETIITRPSQSPTYSGKFGQEDHFTSGV